MTVKTAGSEALIDVTVVDTPVFLQTTTASNGTLSGSIVLNNVQLYNVPVAVGVAGGEVVLKGSTNSMYIESWAQGNVYVGNDGLPRYTQGDIEPPQKPWNIVDSQGNIFGRGHPQYPDYSLDQIVSVKSYGATGNGYTDDTAALQNIFNMVCFEGYHRYTDAEHVSTVCWLQTHLLRCRNILYHGHPLHSCGFANYGRGLVGHPRRWCQLPGPEQPQSDGASRCALE